MLALGQTAPNFENLLGTDGKKYSLSSFKDKQALAVIFSCNHCPYVQAYEGRMIAIQKDYAAKGVQLVAINSNDVESSPGDSYPAMVERAKDKGFNFAYLRDEDQSVVDAYGGICTPHVFVFDEKRVLRYRGRIDDSKDPSNVKSPDFRNALDDIIAGRPVRSPDTKPFGCSIKFSEN
jgi:thiol-disulfide isomerase/thioredoxin